MPPFAIVRVPRFRRHDLQLGAIDDVMVGPFAIEAFKVVIDIVLDVLLELSKSVFLLKMVNIKCSNG